MNPTNQNAYFPGLLTAALVCVAAPQALAQYSTDSEESVPATSDPASHELGHTVQQKAPRTAPGERVMRPEYGAGQQSDPENAGRTKVTFPAVDGSDKAQRSDPDRPVITGRVPNTESRDGTVPTEILSMNFEKIRVSSVDIRSVHRDRSRSYLRGADERLYLLPDGVYGSKTDAEIQVAGGIPKIGDVTLKRGVVQAASKTGDVIVKGSTIKENAVPPDEDSSAQASGRRTYEPIVIRKRIDKSSPLVADGRYSGPGGAWFELKGGKVVSVGGPLERQAAAFGDGERGARPR